MRVHYIKPEPHPPNADSRISIGGAPILTEGQEWPHCKLCKAPMIFFFQLDIEKGSDLPLKPGSHLAVFMCPVHNDAPSKLVDAGDQRLPDRYWDKDFGHYRIILNKTPKNEVKLPAEKHLIPMAITMLAEEEQVEWDGQTERGSDGFKLGGVPWWFGKAEHPVCSCRADMVFLCQIPVRYRFKKSKNAPVQPDPVSADSYVLFSGKQIFLFACKDQCTSYSVYAIADETIEDHIQSA